MAPMMRPAMGKQMKPGLGGGKKVAPVKPKPGKPPFKKGGGAKVAVKRGFGGY